jgi:hypothetical protein
MALVLAAASVMAGLGQWQLDRARENGDEQQKQEQARPVTALDGVLRARRTFPGRGVDLPVTVARPSPPERGDPLAQGGAFR